MENPQPGSAQPFNRVTPHVVRPTRFAPRFAGRSLGRAALLLLLPLLLAVGALLFAPAQSALAQEPDILDVEKTIVGSPEEIASGGTLVYAIYYTCASVDTDCANPTLRDVLPPGVRYVGVEKTPEIVAILYDEPTNTVEIDFGAQLEAGTTGVVQLTVQIEPGTPPGTEFENTVQFEASNSSTVTSTSDPVTTTGDFEMFPQKRVITNPIVQGEPIQFALEVCSPDVEGGVRLTNARMTDVLPPGAEFVTAQGVENVDWTYNPATRRLTFLTVDNPVPVGGCTTRTMTLRYPVGTSPLVSESNQLIITGVPEGCSNPNNLPARCDGATGITLTTNIPYTVVVPFADFEVTKTADAASSFVGTEALPGEVVTYTISARNSGYLDLTTVYVTDTIPADIDLTSFTVSPNGSTPVSGHYRTNLQPAWQALPGNPYTPTTTINVSSLGLAANEVITMLGWDLGDMPKGAPTWSANVYGTVADDAEPGETIVNTARGQALDDGDVLSQTVQANVIIIQERTIPRTYKGSNATGELLPNETVTFTVRVKNEDVAHLDLVNPIMADLLPIEFEYVPGSFKLTAKPLGAPDPQWTIADNYDATGRTLLRAAWTAASAYSLQPGQEFVLQYAVKVKDGTSPRTIVNTAIIASLDNPEEAIPCANGEQVQDTHDLDGDGNRTEIVCATQGTSASIEVGVIRSLSSRKLVKGAFDSQWGNFGHTAPGSTADYKLVITNTSNVSVSQISVVDILPFIGDVGVVDPTARQSTWRPNLIGPVTGPSGVPLTVYYSRSSNPCRTDLVASGPAGCDPAWSTQFPRNMITEEPDPTLVKSLKFVFCDSVAGVLTTNCLVLQQGEVQELTWPMRAPVDAPVSPDCALENPVNTACKIAWNSFGVTAVGGGFQFRPTEPKKVGIGLQEGELYSVGDQVWIDIAGIQADGIQQAGETGLNGVRVELWNADTNSFVSYTLTADKYDSDPDDAEPGYYQFAELPAGNYFLRFFIPDVVTASPGDQGANNAVDSDGIIPGTSAAGNYMQTANFALGPSNPNDMTWDQGLWRVSDYGDAPYGGAFSYPTSSVALQAAGGNPANAARHIIGVSQATAYYMGTQRDAEIDGVPSIGANGDDQALGDVLWGSEGDDEDGVALPQLVPGLAGQGDSGVFVRGYGTPVPVTLKTPTGKSGYLNAWVDWDGDGQWEAGEQIADDLSAGTGTINLTVTPPPTAVLGSTYVRFRFSPTPNVEPTGMVFEGEVEDYRLQVIEPPAKTIRVTSEEATAGPANAPHVTIGEVIRYRLRAAIPEGQVGNVVFNDNLTPGLQYLGGLTVTVESDQPMTIANPTPVVSGGPFGSGTDPIFTFGNITNADSDANGEFITLEFNALLLNELAMQAGSTPSNVFTLTFTNFTQTSIPVFVTVVEPTVIPVKSIDAPAPTDAGDPLVYRLVTTNPGGANSSPAFDVVISDTIDSRLTIENIAITASSGVVINNASSGSLVDVRADRLDSGESVTVIVTTRVSNSLPARTTIPNFVKATWTSLPGEQGTTTNPTGGSTPGNSGDPTGERNGSSGPGTGLNNYAGADAEPVVMARPAIDKQQPVPATYTIGEAVTYDVLVTMPEGTTRSVVVTDLFPAGLLFLDSEVITAAANSSLLTADFAGTLPTPTRNIAAGDGNDVTWTFGDVVNPANNNADNDKFVIRIEAVVRNILANQAGTTIDNNASLTFFNPGLNGPETLTDTPVRITLVEPVLNVTKSVAPTSGVDAGDEVIYTINLAHAANSVGTAWNVMMTDTLPAGLENFAIVDVTATGITVPAAAISGNNVRVPATGTFDMPPGATVTLRISAEVADSAAPGVGITNRAGTIWSSMPGNPEHERTAGSNFPDGVDPLNGGGLNDYEHQTSAVLTPANKDAVTKALTGTSAAHTAGSNVTIGEIVTYTLNVTLGEGTIPSLEITDVVPQGMAYVGGSLLVNSTGFGGTLPTPTVAPTGNGTTGQAVTVNFGQIVVTGDNVLANNGFSLVLKLRVLDEAGNVGVTPQTVLQNKATWRVGTNPPQTTNIVDVTVVEPKLSITKTIVPNVAAANDNVTVTLVAGNIGTSTAFSSTLTDDLPDDLIYVGSLTHAGGIAPATMSQSGGVVTAMWNRLEPGQTSTITFIAKLAPNVALGQVITNEATVGNASTLPGTDPGERTEPSVKDDDTVTVVAPEIGITKDDGRTNVVGGELLVYELIVTNYGTRAATGVVITDTVPANTSFVAASSDNRWVCANGGVAGSVCTLALGDLDMGVANAKSVDFAVRIDPNIPLTVTSITNVARTADDGTHGPDPDPTNNSDDDVDVLVTAALGNFVWVDTNGNGQQDAGEPVVPNVTVRLLTSDGNTVLGTTTTNASGIYSFTNLYPGDYVVEFVKPAGYKFTTRDQGSSDAADSDVNLATGRTPVVSLPANTYNDTLDAGLYRPAAIGNQVWFDVNIDGIFAGESGVDGVTVRLLSGDGTQVISSTTTSGGGFYNFTDLIPGSYIVEVVPPATYAVTPVQDATATTDALDSDIAVATGRTIPVELSSGETDNTWDGGLFRPAALGNFVWEDTNGNGQQDAGEPGIRDVVVNLLSADGNTVIGSTLTDANGFYSFTNLLPGTYVVEFVKPDGYKFTPSDKGADATDSDANLTTGRTIPITLVNGQTDNTWDAGLYRPAAIGNQVWLDANVDGALVGESGVDGVTVRLLSGDGTQVISSTTTSGGGFYNFTDLLPGSYVVEVVPPAAYRITPAQDSPATTDALDSDIAVATGRTIPVELSSGETDNTWDGGLYEPAALGNFVWVDTNGNGQQDAGEPVVPGVTVRLLSADGGTVLRTTATDASGIYSFTNLVPGQYVVEFVKPAGYKFTTRDQGASDAADSDVNLATGRTEVITLANGQTDLTWDAGLYIPAALGNYVWHDVNVNGVQEAGEAGVDGVTVRLLSGDGTQVISSTTTSGGGLYNFTDLFPGSYVVEVVPPAAYRIDPVQDAGATTDALDSDITVATGRTIAVELSSGETDNTWDGGLYRPAALGDFVWDDLNADNRQTAGEPGIPGVTVRLLSADGNTVLGTTVTDGTGYYSFTNLVPGNYMVEFVTPANRVPVNANVGNNNNDAIDSDADTTTGRTAVINLSDGEVDNTWDAGYYTRVSLGNFVWEDTNGNGLQDAGEPGVPNITVNLYRTGDTTPFRTTTTNAQGLYLFNNLRPNDYFVEFVVTGEYTLTRQDQGADNAVDSDAATSTGRTGTITLVSGLDDMTWDAGIVNKVNLGDYVWLDTDGDGVQDAGEAGVASVPVKLYNLDTGAVLETMTDGSGYYGFTNLQPGNYYVEFTPPAGHVFTQPLAGGNTAADSNVSTGTNRTPNILLQSGRDDLTIDAGIYAPAIVIKKYTNGEDADTVPGPTISELSPVTWTYYITNTGSVRLENLALVDDIEGAITCPATALNVGESMLCTKVGAARLGQYANVGTVTATPPNKPSVVVTDNDPSHYTGVPRAITLNAAAFCAADTPFVNVQVSGLNFNPGNPTPLTLTWKASDGSTVLVQSNLPLANPNLLWPGAVVDGAGKVIDYPGWDQDVNGDWYEVPTNLRPTLTLVASVNPTQEVVLTYPLSTPTCSTAPRGYLGNYVWNDTNLDGRQDAGEPPVAGVTVQLFRTGESTPMATTTTAGDGYYEFPNLMAGSYEVVFQLPAGFNFTQAEQGDDVGDSDADLTTGRTPAYVLAEGGYTNDVDAGIYSTGLALRKYTNNVDADEPTGPEILINTPVTWTYYITNTGTVTLYAVSLVDDIQGLVICPQDVLAPKANMLCTLAGSAALGQYANVGTVTAILPGEKGMLTATNPSHYVGYDTPPVIEVLKTPSTELLPYPGGDVVFTIDIVNTSVNDVINLTTLTDTVYGDLNGQGTCSMPQQLALGATYSCQFTKTITIDPDNGGNLDHINVVTGRGTGTNGEPVSDDDDAKVVVPCEYGGTVNILVWHDVDGDGVVDVDEQPINLDQALLAGDRINPAVMWEENNPAIAVVDRTLVSLTTDGRITLSGLKNDGMYTVSVMDDALEALGFAATTATPRLNIDPLTCAPVELAFGYKKIVGLVGDFHWYDVNRNGVADEWYDANNDGTVSVASGIVKLADLEFMDMNANGIVDVAGELSACGLNSTGASTGGVLEGPRATLTTGTPARDRTSVIANTGYYRFTTDGLGEPLSATGTYTVSRNPLEEKTQESAKWYAGVTRCKPVNTASNRAVVLVVQTSDAPIGEESILPAGSGDVICRETTANSWTTNLTGRPNATDLTLDYGIVCINAELTAGLGNRVWIDLDKDGAQDSGETGMAGVIVNLYVNGDFSSPIRTFVTGPDGAYSFTDLIPTQYVVEFVLPSGRVFTLSNAGADDAVDSDADVTTGRTGMIVLAPGQYDPNWDAGVLAVPTAEDPSDEPASAWIFLPVVLK